MIQEIEKALDEMFPDAFCELKFTNDYELLVAVMLSAQTTDKAVNKITPSLFNKYKTIEELAHSVKEELEDFIRPLGLYRNKAKSLQSMANDVCSLYDGKIPNNFDDLVKLAGVGRKTANVFLSVYYHEERFAVDTHVHRVSKRLGFVTDNQSVLDTEKKLMSIFESSKWHKLHHQFIFLGRYICKAQKPLCNECKMSSFCKSAK